VDQNSSRLPAVLSALDRISRGLNAVAEVVTWILVALTIIVTMTQVVFRYGLESSLSWSEELARYMFVWIIFIGASIATRRQQHIFVEALIAQFPDRLRAIADLLGILASVTFFIVLGYVSWLLMLNAWQQYSTALDVRIAYVYAAAPIGAALSVLHLIVGLWKRLTGNAEPAHSLFTLEGVE
jgi:TRAP-type C4-dicarboxylate transport system permease small subunit